VHDQIEDLPGELHDGDLGRITEVHGLGKVGMKQTDDSLDEVGNKAEAARLLALTVDGQGFAHERLSHEVRKHATVVEPHAGTVRVENADDPRLHRVEAVVSHRDGFGKPLSFVVAAARANGIDVAPVIFSLRMDLWIAVNL